MLWRPISDARYVLQRVLDAYAARNWRPMVAFELEFYLFDGARDADGMLQIVRNPKTGRKDSATVLSTIFLNLLILNTSGRSSFRISLSRTKRFGIS